MKNYEEALIEQMIGDSEGHKCEISMLLDRVHGLEESLLKRNKEVYRLMKVCGRAALRIVKLTECVKEFAEVDTDSRLRLAGAQINARQCLKDIENIK